MSESQFPGPGVVAAMEYLHGQIESARPLLETNGIGDGDIAAALRELADWYQPEQAAVVALVDGGGVWLRVPNQMILDRRSDRGLNRAG